MDSEVGARASRHLIAGGLRSVDSYFFDGLISRYALWQRRFARNGRPPWNDAHLEDGRLWLREGFPHPDWRAFVLAPDDRGWAVSTVTTERRVEPLESPTAYTSDVETAEKYVIWKIANGLRVDLRLPSLSLR